MSGSESKRFAWAEWKHPLVAIVLTFLCNVEGAMLLMGEWPYMITIDQDATANFYGLATAANKAGHVAFAFIFAVWAQKISGIKVPMIVGRCITLVACVMYIFVEFIPTNRRWWMLACNLLFGVGFGTSPLLRSYVARVTSEENRSAAYALQNGAMVLSLMVGPMVQMAFAGLPYPGVDIIPPNLKLNDYWADLVSFTYAMYAKDKDPVDFEQKKRDVAIPARDKLFAILEKEYKANGTGFLVGASLTWVDLLICDHMDVIPGFFDDFPGMKELMRTVTSIPKLQEWLEMRPNTKY